MDKKRILFAILFAVVVIIVGFIMYWVFFSKPGASPFRPTPPEEVAEPGQFPTGGPGEGIERPTTGGPGELPTGQAGEQPGGPTEVAGRVEQVVDNRITSPQVNSRGDLRFYNRSDGRFYRLNPDGSTSPLQDQVFFNAENVTWSPINNESIIEYPDGNNIYYDFDSGKQVTLPQHWEDFDFAPNGDQIIAKSIGLSPENRWLVASSPDGSTPRLIEPLGDNANKVDVSWSPNNQIIATTRTGESLGAEREEILFVGQNGENFRSFVAEGRGFQSIWSPSGTKLLYSVYSSRSDFNPELWIVNAQGDQIGTGRRALGVNTWANKCVFASDRYVYCGVPMSLESGSGFQPDLANNTPDEIYKIDTQTGLRTRLDTGQQEYNVVDSIFLSEDGNTLYFTDKRFAGLFQIDL